MFHALQYQTDHLNSAGSTPFDQVRPTGPVWLDEGVPEMIAYRVADDRLLLSYSGVLSNQIAITKRIGTPLNQLERLSQTGIPSVYSLFALSVTEHAPGGLARWPPTTARSARGRRGRRVKQAFGRASRTTTRAA